MLRDVCFLAIALIAFMIPPSLASAGGIIPGRINQIIIQGKFAVESPSFIVVFSAKPIRDGRRRFVSKLPASSLTQFKNSEE